MKDIVQIADTIIRNNKNIEFPLKHIGFGRIYDQQSGHILDIRGWGRIQYHSEGGEAAMKLQDDLAEWVVEVLNKAYEDNTRNQHA